MKSKPFYTSTTFWAGVILTLTNVLPIVYDFIQDIPQEPIAIAGKALTAVIAVLVVINRLWFSDGAKLTLK